MAASFQVLSVTKDAVAQIKSLLEIQEGVPVGLRISIKKGGCAGMEYAMDMVSEAPKGDDVVEVDGIKVFVDPSATLYLLGTELGFETTKFRSGFTFQNPNEVSACGCGVSVELKPADMLKAMKSN
ncbi:HesB/IscA family protein [Polycladidibacter stylochi]|uniref:HesB/IscA family protein n=1 Tax=Polycladidibacter stylochi TaxID=1807766 RepID=UPI00082EB77C|nr:iron-sulfur cluster assembly accessory protein [Pseudovibrio stylochi]